MMKIAAAMAALVAAAISASVHAQTYPSKAIRLVVPFPPGGGSDIIGRIVAQKLSEQLKQQVVVDNRAGAGGSIGTDYAVRAAPDGYTLLLASASEIAMNPAVYTRLSYAPTRDLVPIALVATSPLVIVAHPALPVKNVKDLVALAKERTGEINVATSGSGTSNHLASEMLQSLTGARFTHVPYKGAGLALADVVGGQVPLMFNSLPSVLPLIRSGKLNALAVTSRARAAALPHVPTVTESGVRGFEALQWWGVFATAALPKDLVARLHDEVTKVLRAQDVQANLDKQGVTGAALSQAQFAEFTLAEIAKWAKVAKTAGVKLD
ncbi:MAG TPA: tripartite tricarboxylate transporter substrate binding protein [Burkholderiales bacterium]|nr:tripartite tricarboxylate transporter substrate binding protein [Burkholderiales bacterium]